MSSALRSWMDRPFLSRTTTSSSTSCAPARITSCGEAEGVWPGCCWAAKTSAQQHDSKSQRISLPGPENKSWQYSPTIALRIDRKNRVLLCGGGSLLDDGAHLVITRREARQRQRSHVAYDALRVGCRQLWSGLSHYLAIVKKHHRQLRFLGAGRHRVNHEVVRQLPSPCDRNRPIQSGHHSSSLEMKGIFGIHLRT